MSTPMNRLTDREIDEIARRIAGDILGGNAPSSSFMSVPGAAYAADQSLGVFGTVSEAVQAAGVAQKQFVALPLTTRAKRSEEHTSELQSRFGISYAVFC